ncbi:MAG: hypothetical protein WC476_08850 [Phycisphaerae bacterium]|jgi:hypothetical protein
MRIDILGTEYELVLIGSKSDKALEEMNGFRDAFTKKIVVNDFSNEEYDPTNTRNLPELLRQNKRHEIVHAFMFESGLDADAMISDCPWPRCEEIVGWFAIQGPKIYAAWKQAKAI